MWHCHQLLWTGESNIFQTSLVFFKHTFGWSMPAWERESRLGTKIPFLEPNSYWTEFGSSPPMFCKANLLTPGCAEGKYSLYLQDDKQGKQAVHAQKTWTLHSFSGKVFFLRGHLRWNLQLMDFLLIGWGEVTGWCFRNLNHQPSGSNQSGV